MSEEDNNFWNGKSVEKEIKLTKKEVKQVKIVKKKIDYRLLFIMILFVGVIIGAFFINKEYDHEDLTKISSSIDIDNGDLKINWERYQTVDIKLSESLTISESGTYHLTGELENGSINIDAGVSEVRLVLDNVSINNQNGPAIYCANAEDLVIELIGKNTIKDGEKYSSEYDEDVTGAIYSKADLTFQGDGSLGLTSNYQDAIVGKDDVKFNSGNYTITAKDDAIRGKDSVYIVNGTFSIEAGADGVKATNDIDKGKGFILVENGSFKLNTKAKGIKATTSLLIYGGNIVLATEDDAIHSDNYIGITNGNISITSGDDGIHADRELIVDDGEIAIAKAYEGIESQKITINGGKISIKTNDDGINAGGGADNSSTTRPGANNFDNNENCILTINNGEVYVNSTGDGIDSNGWLYFNGGKVIVDGPTNNGNGSLDAGVEIVMNGGEVLAIGSSGMAESLGNTSTINNINIYLSSQESANTKIEIKDKNDNTILSHTSTKSFSHIAAGSSKFMLGESYTIYFNGEKYKTFTISDITTTIGNSNANYNNPR